MPGSLGLYVLGPLGLLCARPTWPSVCLAHLAFVCSAHLAFVCSAHLAFCVLGPLGLYVSLLKIVSPVGLYLYLCLLWRLCPLWDCTFICISCGDCVPCGIVSLPVSPVEIVSFCGDCICVPCGNFTCVPYGDCAFVCVLCGDFNYVSLERLYGLFGCVSVTWLVGVWLPSWHLYVCVCVFVYGLVGLCFYGLLAMCEKPCWMGTEMCCKSLVELRAWGSVNIVL